MSKSLDVFFLEFLRKSRPKDVTKSGSTWKSLFMSDLAFDSLDLTMLSLDIEEEFGVDVHAEDIAGSSTVGDLIDLCRGKFSSGSNVGDQGQRPVQRKIQKQDTLD